MKEEKTADKTKKEEEVEQFLSLMSGSPGLGLSAAARLGSRPKPPPPNQNEEGR
jgi:hypothetical protein